MSKSLHRRLRRIELLEQRQSLDSFPTAFFKYSLEGVEITDPAQLKLINKIHRFTFAAMNPDDPRVANFQDFPLEASGDPLRRHTGEIDELKTNGKEQKATGTCRCQATGGTCKNGKEGARCDEPQNELREDAHKQGIEVTGSEPND